MTKPAALRVLPSEIPASMRLVPRWVGWNYQLRGEKWTKAPVIPWAPERDASSTNPAQWGTFNEAFAAYTAGRCDGIGFVLGDGWIGLDIDGCRDRETGVVNAEALHYCHLLNTYTELSPSQTGLHAITRGRKPGGRCRTGRYELYEHGRYFTMSGHRLVELPVTVEERSAEIAVLYTQLFGNPNASASSDEPVVNVGTDLSDDALLAKASQSAKFLALWGGDFSAYQSQSEADCALCIILSFWTCRDADRIDALFRRSKLYRRKWNREDYRRRTIQYAIALTAQVYQPDIPFCPLEADLPADDIDLNTPRELA